MAFRLTILSWAFYLYPSFTFSARKIFRDDYPSNINNNTINMKVSRNKNENGNSKINIST